MRDIGEYFKPIMKNGQQVSTGLDYGELSADRARELFPKNKKQRAAFQQGFLEATELNLVLNEKNKDFEPKRPALVEV